MNRIGWWLVDLLSRALEPGERDAVRGDFAESGESAASALRGVLGLIVRRQAELWKDWRPWVALIGGVAVAALPLSKLTFLLNGDLSEQLRTYWPYGVHSENGLTVTENVVSLTCRSLALLLWTWTGGFVLGSLSAGAIWLTGTLFYLALIHSFWVRLALSGDIVFGHVPLASIIPQAVLPFFGIATTAAVLAAIWGIIQGRRVRTLELRQALLLGVAATVLTSLVVWTDGWGERAHEVWSGGVWPAVPWQTRLRPLILASWPVGYLLASAMLRRWRRTHV